LRDEEGIPEEDEEFFLTISVKLHVGAEGPDRPVELRMSDDLRPRRRRCDLRPILRAGNDRRRDAAKEPLVPFVDGCSTRLYEKFIRAAEPRRLSRREDDRSPHGRDS
jgi:hypothetical protein